MTVPLFSSRQWVLLPAVRTAALFVRGDGGGRGLEDRVVAAL